MKKIPIELTDEAIGKFLKRFSNEGEGCWEWTGSKNKHGYGTIFYKHKNIFAHRFSFAYYKDELDDDLVIDHKCENTSCVNPDHLQQITIKQNTQYSPLNMSIVNKNKPFCVNGHEYKEGSFRYDTTNSRVCIQCRSEYMKKYRRRNLV